MKDQETHKIKEQVLKDSREDVDKVLHWEGLAYIPEIIRTELINRYHDNSLAGHFDIKKTQELVARKYNWPILRANVEFYVKGYNICLAAKVVRHKPYGDLQSLPVPTHQWKDLSMDFVTSLPISTN